MLKTLTAPIGINTGASDPQNWIKMRTKTVKHVLMGTLNMTDMKMTDHQNCKA